MTDARYPERWLNDRRLLKLSAEQERTFVRSLAWSVSNRTDGRLEQDDLALVPGCDTSPMTVGALLKQGLWESTPGGYTIVDFTSTQSTRDQLDVLENIRRKDREKKARNRQQRREAENLSPGNVPGDSPPVQHRKGQDRKGQALVTGAEHSEPAGALHAVGGER